MTDSLWQELEKEKIDYPKGVPLEQSHCSHAHNHALVLAQELLNEKAEEIIRRTIDLSMERYKERIIYEVLTKK